MLWGPEDYLIERRVAELVQIMAEQDHNDPEVISLDSTEPQLRELDQLLSEVPLFAFRRMILVRHPVWLEKPKKGGPKDFERILQGLSERVLDQLHLVLTVNELPNNKKILEAIKTAGAVEEVPGLNPGQLGKWVNSELEKRGMKINREALNALAKSNRDMYYLLNEIERLALCNPGQTITVQELTGVEQNITDLNIFKLTDALLRKNTKQALKALNLLLDKGEPVTLIIHMISREILFLGKVQALVARGDTSAAIAKYLGKQPFRVDKMKGSTIAPREMAQIFSRLAQVDFAIKNTSQDNQLLLETLVIDICEMGRS
ncbi:MAG: DNA polymerase III subunit delta [Syntrophomonadaceae bacterium]|nr:DNA polymerase III subunit delta [Syntrophomonadaceae bacterium]